MDAFLLDAVVRELVPRLVGARINKIYQPAADHLILRFWTGREDLRLSVNLAPEGNALHLTDRSPPNPFVPPRFCQLLRSRLKKLIDIESPRGERFVRFVFSGPERSRYALVAELFGRHANLILLGGDEVIVDVLRRSSADARRSMLPGRPYVPPPRDPNLLSLFDKTAELSGKFLGDEGLAPILKDSIVPMTDLVARDLQARVDQGEIPAEMLKAFRQQCLAGDYRPGIALYKGRRLLSAFRPQALPLDDWQPFETANAAVESFTGGDACAESGFIERRFLEQALAKGRKKLTKRLERIKQEERQAEEFELQKIRGELLLANLHRLKKGMRAVELDNYYQNPPVAVTIELDPLLTPQENAERYFKRYKKSRRGLDHLKRRVDETREEQQWLEQLALDLDEAVSPVDLGEIAEELTDAGFLPRQSRPADPRKSPSLKDRVRKTTSPSGFILYWGRNPRTNDYVSRKLTAATDLWFHAHNMPGCHLVLKREGRSKVPDEDILYAAAVAAGYSRGQNDSRVEVMIADGRDIKKPKGARPGLVTVDRYRTVRVVPIRLPEE